MKPEQLSDFVDPVDARPLRLERVVLKGEHVESAQLVGKSDDSIYAVVEGIPRFVSRENYATNFGLQWQRHRRTQLDSETGATYSRDRLFEASGWERDLSGQRILEAGSGAGRFTEVLLQTGALVHSFDFSDAVTANYLNNGDHPNLVLFQGDIYRIPFPDASFDKVICLGVLQHTPDVGRTFQCLARMVRPGGQLVVDAYVRGWKQLLHWKYLARPFARRMDRQQLYKFVAFYAPKLMPLARFMRSVGGRAGARLVPILDQSDKLVSPDIQRDWTILDTYDALSPSYDYPQEPATLRRWFEEADFRDIVVATTGAAGLHARGTAP